MEDIKKQIFSYLEPIEDYSQLFTNKQYRLQEKNRYNTYRTHITTKKICNIFREEFHIDQLDNNYKTLDIDLLKKIVNNIFSAKYGYDFITNRFFDKDSFFLLIKCFDDDYHIHNTKKCFKISYLNSSKFLG